MNNQNAPAQISQEQETGDLKRAPVAKRGILFFLYLVFCASSLTAFVPVGPASVFALMLWICVLAVIYSFRVRARKAKNKLVITHTTYLIRTFWRACLVIIISCFAGLLYMLVVVDYHPLEKCAGAVVDAIGHGHIRVLFKIFEICGDLIVVQNETNLKIVGFVAFSPVFLYVLWRCVRGCLLLISGKKQSSEGSALI